jgi:hypothetical protein
MLFLFMRPEVRRLDRGALIRAVVSLRNEESGAFGGGQLRLAVLERNLRGPGDDLAKAEAVSDDIRRREFDQAENRQIEPGGGRGVRACGELNLRSAASLSEVPLSTSSM